MEQFLRVGVISRPHGLHGLVKVHPTTDDPRRFDKLSQVLLRTSKGDLSVKIRNVSYFKGQVLLAFEGYDSIESVEGLRNVAIMVSREDAIPLEEGEYYIADLIGLSVETDEGEHLGELTDVLETGANDVYVVDKTDGQILIPAIKDCILDVDIEAGRMIVHLLPGL